MLGAFAMQLNNICTVPTSVYTFVQSSVSGTRSQVLFFSPFLPRFLIDEVIMAKLKSTRAALSNQRALFGDAEAKVKQLDEKFPI